MSTLTAITGELIRGITHVRILRGDVEDATELCNVEVENVDEWLPHLLEYGGISAFKFLNTRNDTTHTLLITTTMFNETNRRK